MRLGKLLKLKFSKLRKMLEMMPMRRMKKSHQLKAKEAENPQLSVLLR